MEEQQALLATDYADKQVVKVTVRGGQAGAVEKQRLAEGYPFVAFSQIGEEIVQVFGDAESLRVSRYDQQLRIKESLAFGQQDTQKQLALSSTQSNRRRLLAPYRWIATQGHLVGYGAVSANNKNDYELGFFDQPVPSPGSSHIPQVNLFHTFSNLSFYLIGNPYVVGIGSEIYFLEMGSYPALYRFDLALGLPSELIEGMPGENSPLKDPKAHQIDLRDRELLMERLDAYEGPWGLYEQQGMLYLLTRSLKEGSPEWHLRRLEIHDNQIDQTIAIGTPLPSRAQQLVLVPTSTAGEWLIFEQSKNNNGRREISAMKTCKMPAGVVSKPSEN